MIPVGDYPNPRSPQWVTRLLVAANIAVYLFISLPLDKPLGREIEDPAVEQQVAEMWKVQGPRIEETYREAYERGDIDSIPPVRAQEIAWLSRLTKYDLVVDRYGYKPGKPTWFALFACMFLHSGFMHVAGNMLMLWIFGDNVEARLGRFGYLAAYLITGVVGTLSFALVSGKSLVPLVGASGAISGVLGFYLIWFPKNQIRVLILYFYFLFIHVRAFWVLGIFLLVQNVLPFLMERGMGGGGVAHGAHIGGFVAGMIGALLFNMFRGKTATASYPLPYVERRAAPWSRVRQVPGAAVDAFHSAVHMGRMEDAAHAFSRYATEGGPPPLPADVFALGRWLYENDFATDAAAVFRFYIKSYAKGEDLDRVHLGLGVLLARRLGQPAAAREHLLTAIDIAREPTVAEKAREELAALP